MKDFIKIENIDYELIKDVNEGFNLEETVNKYTDYFSNFDYIVGDWAYGKLRLKGFMENNEKAKDYNNIKSLETYIKSNCAYNCRYFVIKRVYKGN